MTTTHSIYPHFTAGDDLPNYRAVYELTTRPRGLSKATGGAGQFQFATIFHPATAAKTVRVSHVWVALVSTTAAAWLEFQLWPLTSATTPATGNPAATPCPVYPTEAAAEATCLSLPTTAGTLGGSAYSTVAYNAGITAAASTTNPPPPCAWVDLVAVPNGADDDTGRVPQIRAGHAEGWAVVCDASASATVVALAMIDFTEE